MNNPWIEISNIDEEHTLSKHANTSVKVQIILMKKKENEQHLILLIRNYQKFKVNKILVKETLKNSYFSL